jgi:hypothetical protein
MALKKRPEADGLEFEAVQKWFKKTGGKIS